MLPLMKIEFIPVGPYEVNCCVVWGASNQTWIIDPGCDAERIEALLERNGLSVAAYLITHGHADHINALATLHAARPAPVVIHAEDFRWAFGPANQIPPLYPVPEKPDADFFHPESSNEWNQSGLDIQTLETPGHSRGGVCYWFKEENVCFTGDTLFKGSCGRTDLPGGDGRILAQSLKKLAKLPSGTRMIAGHGEESTIAYEVETNFFLQT